jgi:hypothetical protein
MKYHRAKRSRTMKLQRSIAFALLVGLFCASPLTAQGVDPTAYYRRCEGSINKSYPIVMHLQKRDDDVSGWYYYQKRRETLCLSGKAEKNGDVALDEFPRGADRMDAKNRTGRFTGRWTGSRFSGTWRSADGKKSLPFEVTEAYGTESVRLTPYRLKEVAPLFPDKKGKNDPAATVDLRFLYPESLPNAAALEELRRALTTAAPRDPDSPSLPPSSGQAGPYLRALRDDVVAFYRESDADIYEPDNSAMWNWDAERSSTVVLNDRGLLCLEQSVYEFTGGAHGNYFDSFPLFDLATGKKLAAADVFLPGHDEEWEKLIEAELRKNLNIAPDGSLSDAGFFADSVPLAGEFYVTVDGVGFYYNIYEIAPYALGAFDVFLPWDKVKSLVKPDSPVSRLRS